jgi:hypothetical protein
MDCAIGFRIDHFVLFFSFLPLLIVKQKRLEMPLIFSARQTINCCPHEQNILFGGTIGKGTTNM